MAERPFPCPHCSYRASNKQTLQTHIRGVHEKEKPFPCPHCSYRAAQSGTLTKHIQGVHDGEKPFPCPFCAYRAGHQGNLTVHIHRTHGEKPFVCPHCAYRAAQKGSLTKHMRSTHAEKLRKGNLTQPTPTWKTTHIRGVQKPVTWQCPYGPRGSVGGAICQQCLNRARKTLLSLLPLPPEPPNAYARARPFPCLSCEHRAITKQSLHIHVRSIHNKERPFPCPHCPYRATQKGSLTTHIRSVHNKKKPFPCSYCSYRATRKDDLKKHLRRIHGVEVAPDPFRSHDLRRTPIPPSVATAPALAQNRQVGGSLLALRKRSASPQRKRQKSWWKIPPQVLSKAELGLVWPGGSGRLQASPPSLASIAAATPGFDGWLNEALGITAAPMQAEPPPGTEK
jgi:KRAB domain-containing zinc finger protein